MGVHLALEVSPQCFETTVNIDVSKFSQVLTNLIGNALKFTPRGGSVTVSATLIAAESKVQISVTDTGVGIARVSLTTDCLPCSENHLKYFIYYLFRRIWVSCFKSGAILSWYVAAGGRCWMGTLQ